MQKANIMSSRPAHRWEYMTEKVVRIGNQTAFSASEVMQPFDFAVSHGFDAFEWFPDKTKSGLGWTEDDISKEARARIRDRALSGDISLSVHAPLFSNPFNPEDAEKLFKTVEFAQDIGASLFNIHLYTEKGIFAYVESLTPLIERLRQALIRLSIENTVDTGPEDFNELFGYLRSRSGNISHVGMCLDLGHANLSRGTINDYLKFVDLLAPDLPVIHVHMHENYGDRDNHLPIFTGPAGRDESGIKGFFERMVRRNFSGSIILEQWPQPPDLLVNSRNRLLAMIGNDIKKTRRPEIVSGDDFVSTIVAADRQFHSWRKKLGWIHELLTDKTFDIDNEKLAFLAIYLRFVGTGEVSTGEDGGHYRPSHHARMSRHIHEQLSRITSAENAFIIRKIYPWLPSFGSTFMRAEPLTLIRDIAHRDDIPNELKQEIKPALQNKLHRSAGPEDLLTSARLLERIIASEASYSPSFIKEFKRFHEELREFFNTRSLEEQLGAIGHKVDEKEKVLIRTFLEEKKRAETPEQLIAVFELLTELRSRFGERILEKSDSEVQELQIADIRLEDFSFVLMSRFVNSLTSMNGEVPWSLVMRCLNLATANLRLGGFDRDECLALESEMNAWSSVFDPHDREHLLRLKSTLERSRRMTEDYRDKILFLLPEKVERLGKALGVKDHAIKVCSEADIRSHLVFQVSKLVDLFLKNIRSLAALPPWDAIVSGKVSGELIAADGVSDLSCSNDRPVIALFKKVDGDEEVPAGIMGIVLEHEIPLLSHLAVRARQRRIAFAVCEDEGIASKLRDLAGKYVVFDVSLERVNIDSLAEGENVDRGKIRPVIRKVPGVVLNPPHALLPLDQVDITTGGGKAFAVRRLDELSKIEGSGFTTPQSFVIPFGVMEESLRAAPELKRRYRGLAGEVNDVLPENDLDDILQELRKVVFDLRVPHEILSLLKEKFKRSKRLMVRSSSNCEDLEGHASAGLYDSVANADPMNVADSVRKVWSSLWTKRAFLGRKNAGIPHEAAHMAVLIQEMIVPDYSFIIHTVNPVSKKPDEIYAELPLGLGETLASGRIPGTPYRLIFDKSSGSVRMLSFASFSSALLPDRKGGLTQKKVDYSMVKLSTDKSFRTNVGKIIGMVGRFVENSFGMPQDIEGLISADAVYLVQSRPQQGA